MFCMECGCGMVESEGPITEEYRGASVTVGGIRHIRCPSCGEYALGPDGSRKLSRAIVAACADKGKAR